MKNSQFYKYSAIILLIINIIILTFLFIRPRPEHPPEMALKAPKVLNLSEEQETQFFDLVNKHKLKMEKLKTSENKITEVYFSTLYNNSAPDQQAINDISDLQLQKVKSTYKHFEDVKAILKTSQLEGYKSFILQATNMILGRAPLNEMPD